MPYDNNCPIGIAPYDQSERIRNPKIFNLNYTAQDFWSMKTKLVEFIRERFGSEGTILPNTFNDFVESDIAIMLIENWAFLADILSFKMDQIANEIFIDTVAEAENAFRLAKLVGFEPLPPIAAKSLWSGHLNNVFSQDIHLSTPIPFSLAADGEPLEIELFQADSSGNPIFDQDIIVSAGSDHNSSIVGLEGHTYEEVMTSTGEVSQTRVLGDYPVIYDSVRVAVDGIQWTRVDYFTDSQPRREFRVEFDSDYRAYVVFGNNRAGLMPPRGSRITVTYRVGGGTRGNIVTDFAQVQRQVYVPGLDYSVPITFRNFSPGKYGYDGDTIEDIRAKLPAYLRVQNRAVSGLDYKTLADQFASPYNGKIGRSTAVLRNHGCAGNIIDLYVLAQVDVMDLEKTSSELKVELANEINAKKMLTDFVCIRDGMIIYADVGIEVMLDKSYRKFEEEIKQNILNRTNAFFSLHRWEYGKTLKDIDLVKELSQVRQVDSYTIEFTTDDEDNSGSTVTTKYYEIVRPDNINISFSYT